MAFRLGDKLYKEILYGYAEDLTTTNPLYVLTQLSDGSVEVTAESTEVKDKNGNLVKKIWKSKAGTFSAKNAFVNTNIIAASAGTTPIFASNDNKVTMPKMFHVKKGTDVTIKDYVAGSVKVAQYFGDGSIGKTYTLGEAADTEKFAIESTSGKLSLPTDTEADMFFIKYLRESETGAMIQNKADEFPNSVKFIIKATYYNPCKKNELKADYIEFPSFQVSPETTVPINADSAEMDFKGDLEIDYCGADKVLYNIYDADEVDAE